MKWDYKDEPTDYDVSTPGLFILCEGNFQYSNATLSFYDPKTNAVENEIFLKANGMKLGDVAQSMTIFRNTGWIAVNNSHVVFAIDIDTFKEKGRIENLTSPRYIHFVSDKKAYISQIWDNRIAIVDPETYSITGFITIPDMDLSTGSTEQMVQIGKYVYCNCWSYQNRILKIDTEIDEVVEQLTVGIQPNSLVADRYGRLWTITDGGYDGSPYGYEAPAIYCIDTETLSLNKKFSFSLGDTPSELQINGDGEFLYWINDDIWKMSIDSDHLPELPLIQSQSTKYYGLTIDPLNNEIYVADAIDYSQQGMIYRFSPEGLEIDSFYVGVTPGAFCWKLKE
ncbi:MAG: glutaminyl-peptide cyclotransferase [Muribaculaceae bacterium]|nr:glutaminyl-peptide cyclotransferase [Muribaculaceae bacterium]